MLEDNKILTEIDKREGFSVYAERNFLSLYFNKQRIAIFENNDLSYQKVQSFINLGRLISLNCMEISNRISKEVENFVEDKFCGICGKKCKKLCKMAQIMYDQLVYQNWLVYVQMN